VDLKTLVASALAAVESGDVETIYSLVVIALRELKQKTELTPIAVEAALDELVAEGYAVVYEEATLDFKRKNKKYYGHGQNRHNIVTFGNCAPMILRQ